MCVCVCVCVCVCIRASVLHKKCFSDLIYSSNVVELYEVANSWSDIIEAFNDFKGSKYCVTKVFQYIQVLVLSLSLSLCVCVCVCVCVCMSVCERTPVHANASSAWTGEMIVRHFASKSAIQSASSVRPLMSGPLLDAYWEADYNVLYKWD